MAISGSDDFKVRRSVQTMIRTQTLRGGEVVWVNGGKKGQLEEALTINPLGGDERLVVVQEPEKLPPDFLKGMDTQYWDGVTLLLYCSGDPGKGAFWEFISGLGKSRHLTFPAPKPWDVEKVAAEFCQAEAKARGKSLSLGLAHNLVLLSGSDLGVLAFEIQKMSMLADLDGSEDITETHVIQGRAPIAETSMLRIVESLANKDGKRLALMLRRVRETRKDEPVMELVGWVMTPAVLWVTGRDMQDKGLSLDQAAVEVGMHPYRYKKEVVERVGRWSRPDLVRLLRALAEAQQNVVSGAINPWAVLCARLMTLCLGAVGG